MGRVLLVLLAAALALPATAGAQPCPVILPICEPDPEPTPEPTPEPPPDAPPEKPPPPPPAPVSPIEGSSTLGVDAGRTGYFADATLVPPLEPRWRRKVGPDASAPLSGQGKIYLSFDRQLHALDPKTGRDLWVLPVGGVARAYDAGRVFMTQDRTMRAVSAADGTVLWQTVLDGYVDGSPVDTAGMVYVGTSDGMSALDASDGRIVWRTQGRGDDHPVADEHGVYGVAGCVVSSWSRMDGALLWSTAPECQGGAYATVSSVYRGRLYVPQHQAVYDASTGAAVGRWDGGRAMFAGDVGVFVDLNATIKAVDLDDGRTLWTKRTLDRKDPGGTSRPAIISGNNLYGVSGESLIALDVRTGTEVWRGTVPGAFGLDFAHVAAAPGLLMTVAEEQLVAWENVFNPAPGAIEIGPKRGEAISGTRAYVGGIVGTALRGSGRATLEYDEAPFGRWRRDATGRILEDGWVGFRVRVSRNIRLRVRAGGRRSNVATLYAYPRVRFKFAAAGGTSVRTTATLRFARGVRLGGRRAYLYLGRVGKRRYQRMGSTTVRAGRGSGRAVFVHRVPRDASRRDVVVVCIAGQVRLGLGQNTGLARGCGRRSVRF